MSSSYEDAVLEDAGRDLMARADRANFIVGIPALLLALAAGGSAFAWVWTHGYLDAWNSRETAQLLLAIEFGPMAAAIPMGRWYARRLARSRRAQWVTELARLHQIPRERLDERSRTWF